jgi:CubicO group peptidase (beta-lactamase class C family)
VMGVLVDHSELNLDKPVEYYVPELKVCGYEGATLNQILDMRSGIIFEETYLSTDPACLEKQFDRAMGWAPPYKDSDPKTLTQFLLTLEKGRPHGGYFEYRSVETEVLGWVLSRVTNMNLADAVSKIIWQPLGAEKNAFFTVDSENTCVADGGFNATLRDYARFGQLFAQQGYFNNKQIVSEEWIASCRTGDSDAYKVRYADAHFPHACYSRQWWVYDAIRGVHCAIGVGGQLIYINPQTDTVIVKLSSWPDLRNDFLCNDSWLTCEAISQQLA